MSNKCIYCHKEFSSGYKEDLYKCAFDFRQLVELKSWGNAYENAIICRDCYDKTPEYVKQQAINVKNMLQSREKYYEKKEKKMEKNKKISYVIGGLIALMVSIYSFLYDIAFVLIGAFFFLPFICYGVIIEEYGYTIIRKKETPDYSRIVQNFIDSYDLVEHEKPYIQEQRVQKTHTPSIGGYQNLSNIREISQKIMDYIALSDEFKVSQLASNLNVSKEELINILATLKRNHILDGIYDLGSDLFRVRNIIQKTYSESPIGIKSTRISQKIGWDGSKLTLPNINFPPPADSSKCVTCQKKRGKIKCTWCNWWLCNKCIVKAGLPESTTSKVIKFAIGVGYKKYFPFCKRCFDFGQEKGIF